MAIFSDGADYLFIAEFCFAVLPVLRALQLFTLLFGLLFSAGTSERARVVVQKEVKSEYAVEGMPLTFQYNVFNIGDV